ncbi:Cytochrome c553 [Allopseudospirillum japonicum]|uniref:Cytochrome c553 n=1 Tax=Allopseudospirillum japonicum TaxID=64971 RepID=A0A1H6T1S0_9GAMM|nr:c-type cytochrome [Allopseudospirillum japonicum]SEI71037.1 Cytochrome c553 [Allopseudospirillum japonicum]
MYQGRWLATASLITCSLISLPSVSAPLEGDATRGQQLVLQGKPPSVAPCAACHGVDGAGNAAAGFARLAGLDAGYIAKQLADYQAKTRTHAIMSPNAVGLTAQERLDVGAYYAAQVVNTQLTPSDTAKMALGEHLAKQGDWDRYLPPCESCHGPDSQGVGADFPALSGQHVSYLAGQLTAWQQGQRTNDPLQLMLGIAERLTAEEIEALAYYFAHQPTSTKEGR